MNLVLIVTRRDIQKKGDDDKLTKLAEKMCAVMADMITASNNEVLSLF